MTARYYWLALLGIVAAGEAAGAAPVANHVAAAPAAAARVTTSVPTIDLTRLFDRMTVPLGIVPVID